MKKESIISLRPAPICANVGNDESSVFCPMVCVMYNILEIKDKNSMFYVI